MRKVVWLNHWFSTAYNIINLIKEDDKYDFYIIGSSELNYSVLKEVCDEWHSEPKEAKDEEYVNFCLDFCKKHNVDIFVPYRNLVIISKFKNRFEELGIKVLVDNYDVVSLLNNKQTAYDYFKNIITVPDYYVVETLDEFINAYNALEKKFNRVCFKFIRDEGGKSYRLIDNNRKGYADLFKKQSSCITLNNVVEALSEKEKFPPIMIMPYLEGDEISVDCLKTENGIIMIPRIKGNTRFETVRFDEEIIQMCSLIYDKLNIECPCNIQFKYKGGIPYFLEINTRMSGGTHMTCMAANVNIPNIAVNKLLGCNKEWQIDKKEKTVSQVEIPLIFN